MAFCPHVAGALYVRNCIVDIDALLDIALYRIRVRVLDNGANGFLYRCVFALNEPAFESRLVPGVVFLVLVEETRQSFHILSGLVPHFFQAHVKQQNAVVIFLNKMAQVFIFVLQMSVRIGHHIRIGHVLRQTVLGAGLSNKRLVRLFDTFIALHVFHDLRLQRLKRLYRTFALQLNKVPPEVGLNRFANIAAVFHRESSILKGLNHISASKPTKIAAAHGRTLVVRLGLSYCRKVCTAFHHGIQTVNRTFGCDISHAVAARHHLHDMRGIHVLMLNLLFYQCDMKTVRTAEHRRYFAYRSRIYGILKRINITERHNPTQLSTGLGGTRVCGLHTGYLIEIFLLLLDNFPFLVLYRLSHRHALADVVDLG